MHFCKNVWQNHKISTLGAMIYTSAYQLHSHPFLNYMESTHFVVNGSGFKMSQPNMTDLLSGQLLTYWVSTRVFTLTSCILYSVFCFIQIILKDATNRYSLSLGLKRKNSFSPK
jgi:hypothetical protein